MRRKVWAFNPHSGGKKITPLTNIMTENYDTSWDLIESNKGNLPDDGNAYERKYQEWKTRD